MSEEGNAELSFTRVCPRSSDRRLRSSVWTIKECPALFVYRRRIEPEDEPLQWLALLDNSEGEQHPHWIEKLIKAGQQCENDPACIWLFPEHRFRTMSELRAALQAAKASGEVSLSSALFDQIEALGTASY